MFIKGCPHALGCTIFLKGAPIQQLRRVKKVARVSLLACRWHGAFSLHIEQRLMLHDAKYKMHCGAACLSMLC